MESINLDESVVKVVQIGETCMALRLACMVKPATSTNGTTGLMIFVPTKHSDKLLDMMIE